MANEVYYSTSGDVRLPAILHAAVADILHDTSFLKNDPVWSFFGDQAGSSSTSRKVGRVGLGAFDNMAAVAEGSAVANTALTDASSSFTIARQSLMRTISDINHLVDSTGRVNVMGLAREAVMLADKRHTDLMAQAGATFTTVVGATAVEMVTDDFYDAQYALRLAQNRNPSEWLMVLNAFQMNSLTESVRSEGGAFQWKEEARELLNAKGQGEQGTFNGIRIAISSLVPVSSSDATGFLSARGGLGYIEGSMQQVPGVGFMQIASPVITEFGRDWTKADTQIVHDYYVGVGLNEDARGVAILTLGE